MAVPETLLKLLTAAGPSGYEQAPAAVFREAAGAFAEVTHDSVGSTVAKVPGTGDGRSVAIVGHIDEIGLIVHHIDDDGFLWFTGVGGWDPVILVGQRVEVATRDGAVLGVVGKKPIHLLKTDEERKKAPELKGLHIDIGAKDGDDARSRVRIGDVAVIAGEPVELPNGRLVSRSLDNRLGCFVALETARLVAEAGGAPGDVYGAAVAQEEITFAGARTTAFSLRPDVAIAVDVTFATDAPGTRREGARPPPLRLGPRDRPRLDARPASSSSCCTRRPRRRASRSPWPPRARSTGTDADAIHTRRRRHPDRRRLDPAALHALAGRDGRSSTTSQNTARLLAAFAQAPEARHGLPPLTPPAPAAVRHRRHAAPARLDRARAGDRRGGRRRSTGSPTCTPHQVEAAGRTDLAIARTLLLAAGVAADGDRRARRRGRRARRRRLRGPLPGRPLAAAGARDRRAARRRSPGGPTSSRSRSSPATSSRSRA